MPKYGRYQPEIEERKEKNSLHPVWRGIGCVLLIVIPAISVVLSNFLINQRQSFSWVIVPVELIISRFKDPLIAVKAVYFLIIALLLFLIIGSVTFILDKIIGSSRRGKYHQK